MCKACTTAGTFQWGIYQGRRFKTSGVPKEAGPDAETMLAEGLRPFQKDLAHAARSTYLDEHTFKTVLKFDTCKIGLKVVCVSVCDATSRDYKVSQSRKMASDCR